MKLKLVLCNLAVLGVIGSIAACTRTITEEVVVTQDSGETKRTRNLYELQLKRTNELVDKHNEMLKANFNTHTSLWSTQVDLANVDEAMKNSLTRANRVHSLLAQKECDATLEESLNNLDKATRETIANIAKLEQQISIKNLKVIETNVPLVLKEGIHETQLKKYREQTQEFMKRFNGFREIAVSLPFHVKKQVSRTCHNEIEESSFSVDDYRPKVENASYESGGVRGKVFAQNGSDPVVDALIYVPVKGNENLPDIKEIRSQAQSSQNTLPCGEPQEPYIMKTCSNANGEYELLEVPAGEIHITIRKGLYALRMQVNVQVGVIMQMESEQTTLASEGSENADVARITVVDGSYDHLEKVLNKIGLSDNGISKYNLIRSSDFNNLVADPMLLNEIDLLMINCGNSHEVPLLNNKDKRENLKKWVENGGRLFVTDQAYDFVEQIFPSAIRFRGDQNDDNPGVLNFAEKGHGGMRYQAEINSPSLLGWLKTGVRCGDNSGNNENCVNKSDQVQIQGFAGGWAIMDSTAPSTTAWVLTKEERPLTVTFDQGKGKVFYSSYHTDHGSDAMTIAPQERILQYFVFEVVD